jgi:hypothetical protein
LPAVASAFAEALARVLQGGCALALRTLLTAPNVCADVALYGRSNSKETTAFSMRIAPLDFAELRTSDLLDLTFLIILNVGRLCRVVGSSRGSDY